MMQAFPKVNFRYLAIPSKPMEGGLTELNFNNETTWPWQMMGREDGANVIHKGADWLNNVRAQWIEETSQLPEKFADFSQFVQFKRDEEIETLMPIQE